MNQKVAIIHDHVMYFSGAERILFTLLKMYPRADIYTSLITRECRELLQQATCGKIVVSGYNAFPFAHRLNNWFKPWIIWYWEQLDLSVYDLVISVSHSFSSKSVITSPRTLHVAYVLTPPRYLYTEYNETQIINNRLIHWLLSPFLSWLRVNDFVGAQRPDLLIAISRTVQARIKKYYRRDSLVIYPPVTLLPPRLKNDRPKTYFVCISRLAKPKGIELAIRACNRLKTPLVVVGEGAQARYLKSIAGPTIAFRGHVSDEQIAEIYVGAKALIYPSIEEDFGLVPVEAMGHGVPVIGYNSGGTSETVENGKTGILFDEYSTPALIRAIQAFHKIHFAQDVCRQQAARFSKQAFITNMQQAVKTAANFSS